MNGPGDGQVCCCGINPITNCGWQSQCNGIYDYSNCGTYWGGGDNVCCCSNSQSTPGRGTTVAGYPNLSILQPQDLANLKPDTLALMQIINDWAAQHGVTLDITSLISNHSPYTSSGNLSQHGAGEAMDIQIHGQNGSSAYQQSLYDLSTYLYNTYNGHGLINDCFYSYNATHTLDANIPQPGFFAPGSSSYHPDLYNDHLNHIHVSVIHH
jgi:hypothetical protein